MRILTVPGCEGAEEITDLVRAVIDDMGLERVELSHEVVLNQKDAERKRFLGSPTVMIDGVDIEWSALDNEFAYGCRLYMSCGRIVRQPSSESIRESMIAAGAKRVYREWQKRIGSKRAGH